jgi:electron transport complex protein RnfA
MADFFLILFSTALVNNIIVIQVIGIDPALAFSRKLDVAFGLSYTLLVMLPLVTVFGYSIDNWLLVPFSIEYLRLLIFVLLIVLVSWCLKLWLYKINRSLNERVNVFFPYAVINTTVLGTLLLNQQFSNNLFMAFAFGIGTAIGFSLILLLLTAITERLEVADVPVPFKGIPVLLITLGLLSMAFLGFIGLVNF